MTREEAIKIIDCYDIGFYDLSGEKIPAYKLADAFDMAIEALLAQPQPRTGKWIDTGSGTECSRCHEITYGYDNYRNYCPICGSYNRGGE